MDELGIAPIKTDTRHVKLGTKLSLPNPSVDAPPSSFLAQYRYYSRKKRESDLFSSMDRVTPNPRKFKSIATDQVVVRSKQ